MLAWAGAIHSGCNALVVTGRFMGRSAGWRVAISPQGVRLRRLALLRFSRVIPIAQLEELRVDSITATRSDLLFISDRRMLVMWLTASPAQATALRLAMLRALAGVPPLLGLPAEGPPLLP